MSPFDVRGERRRGRRIPMGCKARLKSLLTGETHYGECVELSVDGLSVRSSFVPQFGEQLEVVVMVPPTGALDAGPLEMLVEVKRCNEVEPGKLYDIGMKICSRGR